MTVIFSLVSQPLMAQSSAAGPGAGGGTVGAAQTTSLDNKEEVGEGNVEEEGAASSSVAEDPEPLVPRVGPESSVSLSRRNRPGRDFRADEPALDQMDLEQMKAAGYVFAREQKPLFSSQAVRMSLTLGAFVHGIGHLTLGDYGTGFFLLGMEIAGILLVVGGALIPELYEESPGMDILTTTMVATGVPMMLSSWLFDISGTFRAEGLRLGSNSGNVDGLSIGLGYRLLRSDPSPVSHVIDVDVSYAHRWFYVKASTLQDVELNYQSYGLNAGARFLRDSQRSSELGVAGYGEYNTYVGLGEYREVAAGAKIFSSLDMGYLFPTLAGTSLGLDVGWDLHFPYVLDDEKHFQRIPLRQSYMYYFYSRFGISDALTFTLGYRRREDVLVSPRAIPFGTFVAEFRYLTRGESDVSLGFEVSEGFVVWVKGRINLFN